MAGEQIRQEQVALHEPHLLSPSLSSIRNGGEGARRAGAEAHGFMVSIRVRLPEMRAIDETLGYLNW
jgi:hypothetical protein